jgi:ATP-dependent exoDNAse (exonuclease V) beta subunit
MSLKIYKASAGSGKTYTLAVEYIKFLIQNPLAYRQILAVTFTNKATAEMKERIVQQLYGLATGDTDSDSYLRSISKGLGGKVTDEVIRKNAGIALQNILHDYSRFRVQTIDAFFQEVMRNLARELNLMPGMTIELNTTGVVNQAVEHLIDGLQRGNQVLGWIESFIEEQISEGKKWDVTADTQRFGTNLFNENYLQYGKKQSEMLLREPTLIKNYRNQLKSLEKAALEEMKDYGDRFFSLLNDNGLSVDDLAGKGNGISSYFNKLSKGTFLDEEKVRNKTVEKHLESAEAWCTKTSKRRAEIVFIVEGCLLPLLREAEQKRGLNTRLINTCQLSLRHLSKLQLLDSISQQVNIDNKEANRFLLSGTNALLHSLMEEGDANFIFEKIGTSIKHVMIDEFQDTSSMQWDNFMLLLDNILSEGKDSLIVGDVKQSIYRWRNGDWNILNRLGTPNGEFHRHILVESLNYNRRSESRIVDFNNALFQEALPYFRELEPKEPEKEYEKLQQAYSDVNQLLPEDKEKDKGFVKVSMVNATKDYVEETISLLGEEVKHLMNSGIEPNQMAILLRNNLKLPDIATYFETELGIHLGSDEAFLLSASEAVCLLIDALRVLSDPENVVAKASLRLGFELLHKEEKPASWHSIFSKESQQVILPPTFSEHLNELSRLPLYELVEELYSIFELDKIKKQDAYLLCFMDEVSQYLTNHPSDISAFLNYWEEELSGKSIPSSETDGIRVLTIHKSKGLQFHTVLIPFCDWTLEKDGKHELLMWNKSVEQSPFNALDIIPMNYGKQMRDSLYQADYEKERLQLWVDNLNLLYVAVTRAEKNLLMWSKASSSNEKSKKNSPAYIYGLLEYVLPKVADSPLGTWNAEESIYELGTLCTDKSKTDSKGHNKLAKHQQSHNVEMVSVKPKIQFRQSNRSADFIAGVDEEESPQRFINRGKLLHEVFSAISTKEDIQQAIDRLVFEGVIGSQAEEQEIKALTEHALTLPEVQEWYSGKWKLFNECDIIWMEHDELKKRRPDRVMQHDNDLVVVDFKFGQPQEKYHRQVQGYMNLLRGMVGNENKTIRGYLWYVDNDIIERV